MLVPHSQDIHVGDPVLQRSDPNFDLCFLPLRFVKNSAQLREVGLVALFDRQDFDARAFSGASKALNELLVLGFQEPHLQSVGVALVVPRHSDLINSQMLTMCNIVLCFGYLDNKVVPSLTSFNKLYKGFSQIYIVVLQLQSKLFFLFEFFIHVSPTNRIFYTSKVLDLQTYLDIPLCYGYSRNNSFVY